MAQEFVRSTRTAQRSVLARKALAGDVRLYVETTIDLDGCIGVFVGAEPYFVMPTTRAMAQLVLESGLRMDSEAGTEVVAAFREQVSE